MAMIVGPCDPTDNNFALSLAMKGDETMLCNAHVTIREDILLVRRTMTGNIFLQCKYCMDQSQKQNHSVIIPRSLKGIMRNVLTFKTKHIPICVFIPDDVKET